MTSVLSTLNPLFEKNQTLTRSIYSSLGGQSSRASQQSEEAKRLEDGASALTLTGDTLEWTVGGERVFAVDADGTIHAHALGPGVTVPVEDTQGITRNEADDRYLSQVVAERDYETRSHASGTYLNSNVAESTYLRKTAAETTYLEKSNPAGSIKASNGDSFQVTAHNKLAFDVRQDATVRIGAYSNDGKNMELYHGIQFFADVDLYGNHVLRNLIGSGVELTRYVDAEGDRLVYTAKAIRQLLSSYVTHEHLAENYLARGAYALSDSFVGAYLAWTADATTRVSQLTMKYRRDASTEETLFRTYGDVLRFDKGLSSDDTLVFNDNNGYGSNGVISFPAHRYGGYDYPRTHIQGVLQSGTLRDGSWAGADDYGDRALVTYSGIKQIAAQYINQDCPMNNSEEQFFANWDGSKFRISFITHELATDENAEEEEEEELDDNQTLEGSGKVTEIFSVVPAPKIAQNSTIFDCLMHATRLTGPIRFVTGKIANTIVNVATAAMIRKRDTHPIFGGKTTHKLEDMPEHFLVTYNGVKQMLKDGHFTSTTIVKEAMESESIIDKLEGRFDARFRPLRDDDVPLWLAKLGVFLGVLSEEELENDQQRGAFAFGLLADRENSVGFGTVDQEVSIHGPTGVLKARGLALPLGRAVANGSPAVTTGVLEVVRSDLLANGVWAPGTSTFADSGLAIGDLAVPTYNAVAAMIGPLSGGIRQADADARYLQITDAATTYETQTHARENYLAHSHGSRLLRWAADDTLELMGGAVRFASFGGTSGAASVFGPLTLGGTLSLGGTTLSRTAVAADVTDASRYTTLSAAQDAAVATYGAVEACVAKALANAPPSGITQTDADARYLQISDAATTYETQTHAEATYITRSAADQRYIYNGEASRGWKFTWLAGGNNGYGGIRFRYDGQVDNQYRFEFKPNGHVWSNAEFEVDHATFNTAYFMKVVGEENGQSVRDTHYISGVVPKDSISAAGIYTYALTEVDDVLPTYGAVSRMVDRRLAAQGVGRTPAAEEGEAFVPNTLETSRLETDELALGGGSLTGVVGAGDLAGYSAGDADVYTAGAVEARLAGYLPAATATSTYLTKTDAADAYLRRAGTGDYPMRVMWSTATMSNYDGGESYTGNRLTVGSSGGISKTLLQLDDNGMVEVGYYGRANQALRSTFYTRIRFANQYGTYGSNDIINVLNSLHLASYDASTADNFLYTAKATRELFLTAKHPTAENTPTFSWSTSSSMIKPVEGGFYTGSVLTLKGSSTAGGKEILKLQDSGTMIFGSQLLANYNVTSIFYTRIRFANNYNTYGSNDIINVINSTHLANYDASTGDNFLYTAKATEARLANYLTTASAASDYLTKAEAASTYATTGSVGNYLSKSSEPTSSGTRFTADWFMNENNAPYFAIKYGEAPIMIVNSDWLSCSRFVVDNIIRFQNSYQTYGANDITNVLTSSHLANYDASTGDNLLYTAKATEARLANYAAKPITTTLSYSDLGLDTLNSSVPTGNAFTANTFMLNRALWTLPAADAGYHYAIGAHLLIKGTLASADATDLQAMYRDVKAALVANAVSYPLNVFVQYIDSQTAYWHLSGQISLPRNSSSWSVMLRMERFGPANTAWTLTAPDANLNWLELRLEPTE